MDPMDSIEHGYINQEASPLLTEARVSKSQAVRQAGMQMIQKDMLTVNQLFKDLSGIVIPQGDTISSIDMATERGSINSKLALDELDKTDRRSKQHQMAAIRVALFLLCFLILIFIIRHMMHW